MSTYLSRLVDRTLGRAPLVRPIVAPRFGRGPEFAAQTWVSEEIGPLVIPPVQPQPRAHLSPPEGAAASTGGAADRLSARVSEDARGILRTQPQPAGADGLPLATGPDAERGEIAGRGEIAHVRTAIHDATGSQPAPNAATAHSDSRPRPDAEASAGKAIASAHAPTDALRRTEPSPRPVRAVPSPDRLAAGVSGAGAPAPIAGEASVALDTRAGARLDAPSPSRRDTGVEEAAPRLLAPPAGQPRDIPDVRAQPRDVPITLAQSRGAPSRGASSRPGAPLPNAAADSSAGQARGLPPAPVIRVHVGRIDVRAVMPPSAPPPPSEAARLSLSDFLQKHVRRR